MPVQISVFASVLPSSLHFYVLYVARNEVSLWRLSSGSTAGLIGRFVTSLPIAIFPILGRSNFFPIAAHLFYSRKVRIILADVKVEDGGFKLMAKQFPSSGFTTTAEIYISPHCYLGWIEIYGNRLRSVLRLRIFLKFISFRKKKQKWGR